MYCEHFGFKIKPFDVTPDYRFLYLTDEHREALASILYGIHERRGFVVLVGEAGTGKTTLLRAVLSRLDKNTKAAFIFSSDLPFIQVMALILDELGILRPVKRLTPFEAFRRLKEFAIEQLDAGGNLVIMVDEAQNYDPKTIEGLRLLSNLESGDRKMIQVVLAGQPELDRKLSKRAMQHFAQRVNIRRCTEPLDETHARAYIRHRLKCVGYRGPDLFSKKAMNLIWQHCQGIPRRINVLCDNVLLNAYSMGLHEIKAIHVAEAINDLRFGKSNDQKGRPRRRLT
jgi:general secretion pathway protein A